MRKILQLAIVIGKLTIAPSLLLATQPYVPIQPDPVLESWRWTSFPELKGAGASSARALLMRLAGDDPDFDPDMTDEQIEALLYADT